MKIQTRYNRITIASTLFVLLIAAVGYYFLIHYVLIRQLDEELKEEEAEVHDYVNKYHALPDATSYKDQIILFQKTDTVSYRSFKSLHAFMPEANESEPSRQLVFTIEAGGQQYLAYVTKSEEGIENLVWIIVLVTIGLMLILTMILLLTNRFLFKKLWQPFRSTLSSIKAFNIAQPSYINAEATNINEFNELNESIRIMTQKVKSDYESLKNFTDHASHEMQTPLAVINSKLDVLIQRPELSEESMNQIQSVYAAVDKLAKLSQSLLLLAKIENKQYKEKQVVPIHLVVKEKTGELQEWLAAKDLQIDQQLEPLNISMNGELAEILIGNLLNNAIRHSEPGEMIRITTGNNVLAIANSGNLPLDKERIFDRFAKSDASEGSGLGLAIVKQIGEQYGFRLSYEFIDKKHVFTLIFPRVN